jgi:nucleoporin SEH1
VTKLSWAHPEFGSVIASSSFDRTVKIWEETPADNAEQPQTNGGSVASASGPGTRWVNRAVLADAKGSVRDVEFAPHQFGLKLVRSSSRSPSCACFTFSSFYQATMASDNHLRVYECLEAPALTNWTLSEETDIPALPSMLTSRPHTYAAPTPTHISGTPAADASLVANALQQQQQQPSVQRGAGSREADGGWSVSWCKERYWGEVLATCSGVSGVVKVINPFFSFHSFFT